MFAYRPKPGKRSAFDEGYRRHLAWHRAHRDPFVWYGWDVVTGPDLGLFVDGTFGPSPAEFDARVAPAEDGADFAATVGELADPLWRRVCRRRPDLSTSRFLESRVPSPFVRILTYELRPGKSAAFETLLVHASASSNRNAGTPRASWETYELLDGGSAPSFLLLIPAEGFSAVDAGSPVRWLEGLSGAGTRTSDALSVSVERATSALWHLRRDLTSIPDSAPATGPVREQ